MGKMIVLTFSDSEETVFKRAVSLLKTNWRLGWNNKLFPRLHCSFKNWKYCNISIGCCEIEEMCVLPVLSMVRLFFLLPVQTGYLHSRKSLKLFGAW